MARNKQKTFQNNAIALTINRLYREGLSDEELYEITRGIWRMGARKETVQYALAVYHGIVKEIYKIERWEPAGTTVYRIVNASRYVGQNKWEFVGRRAEQYIRDRYIGHFIGRSNGNPINYMDLQY